MRKLFLASLCLSIFCATTESCLSNKDTEEEGPKDVISKRSAEGEKDGVRLNNSLDNNENETVNTENVPGNQRFLEINNIIF